MYVRVQVCHVCVHVCECTLHEYVHVCMSIASMLHFIRQQVCAMRESMCFTTSGGKLRLAAVCMCECVPCVAIGSVPRMPYVCECVPCVSMLHLIQQQGFTTV